MTIKRYIKHITRSATKKRKLLSKNEQAIDLYYSEDYFESLKVFMQVLEEYNEYLGNTDNFEEFVKHHKMYNDVMRQIINILHNKDISKGMLKWLKKREDSDSCNIMGYMYKHGVSVTVDEKRAVTLFRKSANQENIIGQDSLGMMYLHGIGIQKNEKKAHEWLNKSTEGCWIVIPKNMYDKTSRTV
jgi:TPR repeat protein